MPNILPARILHPRKMAKRDRPVRSTSLRALAVAAHLERSRIDPARHGPGSGRDPNGGLTPARLETGAEPAQA